MGKKRALIGTDSNSTPRAGEKPSAVELLVNSDGSAPRNQVRLQVHEEIKKVLARITNPSTAKVKENGAKSDNGKEASTVLPIVLAKAQELEIDPPTLQKFFDQVCETSLKVFKDQTARGAAFDKIYAAAKKANIDKGVLVQLFMATKKPTTPTELKAQVTKGDPAWIKGFDAALLDPRLLFNKNLGVIGNAVEACFVLNPDENVDLAIRNERHAKRMKLLGHLHTLFTNDELGKFDELINLFEQRNDSYAETHRPGFFGTEVQVEMSDIHDAIGRFREKFAQTFMLDAQHMHTRLLSQLTLMNSSEEPYTTIAERKAYAERASITLDPRLNDIGKDEHVRWYQTLASYILEPDKSPLPEESPLSK